MHVWSAPVRFGECDQQGVVFNANYLAYADEAVDSLWTSLGLTTTLLAQRGLQTTVVASELQWSSPARWRDEVDVDGHIEKVGHTSFVAVLTISVRGRLCCRVRTTYVLIDRAWSPTAVPDDLRELMTATNH